MRLAENHLAELDDAYDLIVVGAGGAGLSCALFAALRGAKVLVLEHTAQVGGTTALSAATTWVPGTQHSASVNPNDSLDAARLYLNHVVGEQSPTALREAFLQHGAQAVAVLEAQTEVKYRPYAKHPDYESDQPGATLNGRALEPLPFDGRQLGPLMRLVRPPIPEFTVLGGMMVDRTDINHLLGMRGSWASLRHSVRILARYGLDRLLYPRGTRWVMGNALIGRLLYSLSKLDYVSLATQTRLESLQQEQGRVVSVTLAAQGQTRQVLAGCGVVLASGGFNRDPQQRQTLLGDFPQDWCPAAPGHTGQAQALARTLGAQFGRDQATHAFWAPVSRRQRADGSMAVFPHFVMDRAKPGMITLGPYGRRFVNESTSYHRFGLAMQKSGAIPAFLVCDARALAAYGLGMVRPGGKGLQPFLADGYLVQGQTLDELAAKLELPASHVRQAVDDNNAAAAAGVDQQFGRGRTAYQHNLGDANWSGKNPNLGALTQAPYYAVRLYPGDIGASTGLLTNECAQVLHQHGQPIAGLFAVGNDMQSIMGATYPAPGITIGPGMVFAYIAAQTALA